uniref:C2H2-type domain-containing protein n=1 Tax=viral metagenome TaxID=1070528 RepID=A0A6C0CUE9_9ZZZZ
MENTQAPEAPEIRCPICHDSFSRNFTLKRHMVRIHGCTYEEYIHNNSSINDNNSSINDNNSSINDNNSSINDNNSSNNHILIDKTNKEYKCTKCHKCLYTNWYLKKHMEKCQGIKDGLSCEYCYKLFSHEKSRYKHYKICKAKKEIDSKALVPILTDNIPTGSTINNSQIATNINNTNIENQNNNTQNNIIVVYNSSGTDFNREHINQEAFMKKILEMVQPHIDRSFVLDYGRELFNNPQNKCIKKDSLKSGHTEVHVGDNKWEHKLDRALYPKLVNDLANNLSELIYTNRNNIPKKWFEQIIAFLDYMADDGYVNTDDKEKTKRIGQDFKMLAKELKLVIYEVTKK